MAEPFYRASFTLPADIAVTLANVAKRAGCSQSAVLSVVLGDLLPYLSLGLDVSDADLGSARRFTGSSAPVLRDLLRQALQSGRAHADAFGMPELDLFR